VLVIDDDAATREMIRRALQAAGWEVQEAENGRVGLERVAAARPQLVLLDLSMPEMDGFDFVAALRETENGAHIPVIVLTAMDLDEDARLRLSSDVQKILYKGARTLEQTLAEVRDLVTASVGPLPAPARDLPADVS